MGEFFVGSRQIPVSRKVPWCCRWKSDSLSRLAILVVACLWIVGSTACKSPDSAEADFEANVTASTQVTAKISYEATIDDPSGELENFNGTMVVTRRPPDRRLDLLNGEKESIIQFAGHLIECRQDTRRPVPDDSRQAGLDKLSFVDLTIGPVDASGDEDVDIKALPNRSIAGMDAECFEARWRDLLIVDCFSDMGGLLLTDTRNPDSGFRIVMRAKSVEFEVSDEDLAPDSLPASD